MFWPEKSLAGNKNSQHYSHSFHNNTVWKLLIPRFSNIASFPKIISTIIIFRHGGLFLWWLVQTPCLDFGLIQELLRWWVNPRLQLSGFTNILVHSFSYFTSFCCCSQFHSLVYWDNDINVVTDFPFFIYERNLVF